MDFSEERALNASENEHVSPRRTAGPNTDGLRTSTGVEGLNDVLGGGLPTDHIYLIQGHPGTGKTTLSLQFLQAGHLAGESTLYITLAESRQELRESIVSHGWNPENFNIYEHLPAAHAMEDTHHTLFHPEEVDLTETMTALLEVVEREKPQRLVLDSLSELQLLAGTSLRYRREVLALKEYFAHHHCTVLLLDDRSVEGDERLLQSLVHGVLLLEAVTPDYGSDRRRMRVTKLRGLRFRGGWHDYAIHTGGLKIYPRLVAAEHDSAAITGRLTSGLPKLDAMFGGGIDRGTTTLLMGPSGIGKSSIATRYAMSTAQNGEKAIMYIFEERPATLYTRAKGLGMNLQRMVNSGMIAIQSIDAAEMNPGEFTASVRKAIEEDGVKLVVIDSLAGYIHSMPAARSLMLHLHELLTYLNQKDVTTIMVVTQHGMLGSQMAGDIDVSYLADNVLLFRYYEYSGQVRKALSVFKKRSGGHENAIRELTMGGDEGIVVGDPLSGFRGIMTGVPVYEKPGAPGTELKTI